MRAKTGLIHVEDLVPGLEKQLVTAGQVRSTLLDIDASGFAASGKIAATPRLSPAVKIGKSGAAGAAGAVTVDLAADVKRVVLRPVAGSAAAPIQQ